MHFLVSSVISIVCKSIKINKFYKPWITSSLTNAFAVPAVLEAIQVYKPVASFVAFGIRRVPPDTSTSTVVTFMSLKLNKNIFVVCVFFYNIAPNDIDIEFMFEFKNQLY